MANPIKNEQTEAKCQELARLAKTDPAAANAEFQAWVDAPESKMKFWEKLAVKERVLYLIKQ